LPYQVVDVLTICSRKFPLFRISQRALFEPHAIYPVSPRDMEMPADDDLDVVESLMPVLRLLSSAPNLESWDTRDMY
jgi:hypothetical protein